MNQLLRADFAFFAGWPTFGLALLLSLAPSRGEGREELEFFETKIRPVLVEHCYECHSSGASEVQGGLVLDYRDGLRAGGDSGPAIVPGEPEASLLLEALRHESFEMPPTGRLADSVIADFEHWIRGGAEDPRDTPPSPEQAAEAAWQVKLAQRSQWWSLQPPRDSELPSVADVDWTREPVDRFILAKLESAGLAPAPPASPEILLRRLAFVLTGLPPRPDQVTTFRKAFHQNPDAAVAAAVDQLLASPHYGERFARHWMDVVRYTDTYGYEWDNPAKGSWEYRDYLIRAFNADIGFDQLIREQIAGDLLPDPRVNPTHGVTESLIGPMFYHMGEHRHGTSLDFNGIHQEMIDNKIDAFSKAFLGMTVACARCHDHKLDAISQADYYALAGVFMTPRWTTRAIDAPESRASLVAELRRLRDEIRAELAQAWTAVARETLDPLTLREWAAGRHSSWQTAGLEDIAYPVVQLLEQTSWLETYNLRAEAASESTELLVAEDRSILARGEVPATDEYTVRFTTEPGSAILLQLEALTDESLGSGGPGRTEHGNFVLSHLRVEVRPLISDSAHDDQGGQFANGVTSDEDPRAANGEWREVKIGSATAGFSQAGYPVQAALDPAPGTGWAIGGVSPLNLDRAARFQFAEPVEMPHGGEWRVTLVQHYGSQHVLGRFRLALGNMNKKPRSDMQRRALDLATVNRWNELNSEWATEREARQQANQAQFMVLTDFSQPGFPEGWVIDGAGLEHGYVTDGTPRIALQGESLVTTLLDRGYHTHALSSKLPGAIRLPPSETFPRNIVSLRMSGGDWAGRIDVPQNAFQAENISFLDPSAGSTWQSVTGRNLNNGVTRLLTEFSTSDLHPNFPPRTGLARAGGTRLPDNDDGFDKRSWFSLTGVVAQETPGTPPDTLDAFVPLYSGAAPASNDEAWQRVAGWLSSSVVRWARDEVGSGDVRVLNWLLAEELLPNRAEQLPKVAELVERYRAVEAEIEFPRSAISMDERDMAPLNYRLNIRGNVDDEGPEIPRGFLEVFSRDRSSDGLLPAEFTGSGRFELARYLTDPRNPHTARVYVNRVWQWVFGTGIVATPNDHGHLGDLPSHPELLDWLALRFMEEGWSTKKLVKQLVLSRTFRQSGERASEARRHDPDNRLLHHYPTRRLEAEAIRDHLLAVSGRLDPRLYGRPINPPRVAEDSAKRLFSGPWDSYGRRSIYITMSIMEPPKFLVGFNLPDLKLPTGRRDETNVPAQALLMLNDPLVTRLAEFWAEQLVQDGRSDPGDRIEAMFLAALGREATEEERRRWIEGARQLARGLPVGSAEDSARVFPKDFAEVGGDWMGDPWIWANVAHAVFNTKEFIYYR